MYIHILQGSKYSGAQHMASHSHSVQAMQLVYNYPLKGLAKSKEKVKGDGTCSNDSKVPSVVHACENKPLIKKKSNLMQL